MSLTLSQIISALQELNKGELKKVEILEPEWLSMPYYVAPDQIYLNGHIALESQLQRMVESSLSDAQGFLDGSKDQTYKNPTELLAVYADSAFFHVNFYNFDEGIQKTQAMAMGIKYGNLLLNKLRHIKAAGLETSIYDEWTK